MPFVTKAKAEAIAEVCPTPFYVYDEEGIRRNAAELIEAFSELNGFKEYFAVKATPNPEILKILKSVGCGVDCASYAELLMVRECGFRGADIMFTGNDTPAREFELARELGATINLDDASHIEFLKRVASIPDRIGLRYNPGGAFSVGNRIMGNPGEAKFGMTRAQLDEAVLALKAEGVKEFGLHAFLASNTLGSGYYAELARTLFEVVAELSAERDATFAYVDLSGGIGVPYRPEDEKNDVFDIARRVRAHYDELLATRGLKPRIYAELGRYMLAPYGGLVTRVIHEKRTYKNYLGVDACAADLLRPAMYGAYHRITVLGKERATPDRVYDVVGALCENNDKFATDRAMPETEIGDLLFIHDVGAHGHSMGYNYNGRLRGAEILLERDGGFRTIRRAETVADYFSTIAFLPEFAGYRR